MPPFGHATPLRIFIDPDLLQHDEMRAAAAGTSSDVFGIEPHKLVEASEGLVADLRKTRPEPPARVDGRRARVSATPECLGAPGVLLNPPVRRETAEVSVRGLVGRFYDELWNEVDLGVAPVILQPDVSFRGSVGSVLHGRDAVCGYVTMVTTALAEYRCDVQELVVEGNRAAATVLFSGVHVAPFLGHPPTGRRVSWMGAAFFLETDGLLADIWVLGDVVSLRSQLDAGGLQSGDGSTAAPA